MPNSLCRYLSAGFALTLLNACSLLSLSPNCVEYANGYSELEPCWLQHQPEQGLVLSANKNAQGWQATLEQLADSAKVEFANERYGSEVTIASEVESSITVSNSDSVNSRVSHKRSSVINSAGESILVKTETKDYYFEPSIERAWAWVVEID